MQGLANKDHQTNQNISSSQESIKRTVPTLFELTKSPAMKFLRENNEYSQSVIPELLKLDFKPELNFLLKREYDALPSRAVESESLTQLKEILSKNAFSEEALYAAYKIANDKKNQNIKDIDKIIETLQIALSSFSLTAAQIFAASRCDLIGIDILIKEGRINIDEKWKELGSALEEAAKQGHLEAVKKLLELPSVNAKQLNIYLVFDLAVKYGHTHIVEFFLQNGSVNVNDCDSNEKTPLMRAAKYGHRDVVNILLDSGAEIHHRNSKNYRTAAGYAQENNKPEIVNILGEYSRPEMEREDKIRSRYQLGVTLTPIVLCALIGTGIALVFTPLVGPIILTALLGATVGVFTLMLTPKPEKFCDDLCEKIRGQEKSAVVFRPTMQSTSAKSHAPEGPLA